MKKRRRGPDWIEPHLLLGRIIGLIFLGVFAFVLLFFGAGYVFGETEALARRNREPYQLARGEALAYSLLFLIPGGAFAYGTFWYWVHYVAPYLLPPKD